MWLMAAPPSPAWPSPRLAIDPPAMPGKRGRKATRGKMGRIQQLPRAIRTEFEKLLRDNVPQAEIVRRLATPLEEIGEKRLSAATVNRYATKMERVGIKIRQTREVAEAWTAKFGESESKLSQHIIEVLRVLVFEHTMQAAEAQDAAGGDGADATPLSADAMASLALTVQRLERAAKEGDQRERLVRQEMAVNVEAEAKRQGLSSDIAAALRTALLGGKPADAKA